MSAKPVRRPPRVIQRCAFCRTEILLVRGLANGSTTHCSGCGRDNLSPLARLLLANGKQSN